MSIWKSVIILYNNLHILSSPFLEHEVEVIVNLSDLSKLHFYDKLDWVVAWFSSPQMILELPSSASQFHYICSIQ